MSQCHGVVEVGGGVGCVMTMGIVFPSCVGAREGCVDRENLSVSQFEQGRGSGGMLIKETPLRDLRIVKGWGNPQGKG